jgi:hypothetical protein
MTSATLKHSLGLDCAVVDPGTGTLSSFPDEASVNAGASMGDAFRTDTVCGRTTVVGAAGRAAVGGDGGEFVIPAPDPNLVEDLVGRPTTALAMDAAPRMKRPAGDTCFLADDPAEPAPDTALEPPAATAGLPGWAAARDKTWTRGGDQVTSPARATVIERCLKVQPVGAARQDPARSRCTGCVHRVHYLVRTRPAVVSAWSRITVAQAQHGVAELTRRRFASCRSRRSRIGLW